MNSPDIILTKKRKIYPTLLNNVYTTLCKYSREQVTVTCENIDIIVTTPSNKPYVLHNVRSGCVAGHVQQGMC